MVKLVSVTKSEVAGVESGEDLIVYCARVSNPENQMSVGTGGRLLRYLIDNKHWSPFEMVDMSVEIRTSRAIAAQILRHRSFFFQEFCIAGDSKIRLIQPNGNVYLRKISSIYKLKKNMNGYIKKNGLPLARVYDGNKFITARIKDVYKTGKKECYKITIADGKSIICTKEHKFLTKDGYKSLDDIVGVNVNGNIASMNKVGIIGTNGIYLYQDKEWLRLQKDTCVNNRQGLKWIVNEYGINYNTLRKWLRVHNLQFSKNEKIMCTKVWNKGKFGYKWGHHSIETINKMKLSARKGSDSNLWRGGVDRSDRLKICDWCNTIRSKKMIEYNYRCKNCGSSNKLELDHIIPVYKDKKLSYDINNIQVLCKECHNLKHKINGDYKIWKDECCGGNFLRVKWQVIDSIEYIGYIDTYDLEIDNDNHNYIANNFIVHNSQRYSEVSNVCDIETRRSGSSNRQSSEEVFDCGVDIAGHIEASKKLYKELIEKGVARECARMVMPLATETVMYMKGSVRSWIHYLGLRLDEHTQKEHREVAKGVKELFVKEFPIISSIIFKESSKRVERDEKRKKIIIVGKSCSGKTTYAKKLCSSEGLRLGVSYTTRPMREGEVDGVDYYFSTSKLTKYCYKRNMFIDYNEFNGWQYGITEEEYDRSDVIILTPSGCKRVVDIYGRDSVNIIYLWCREDKRLERMIKRNDKSDSIIRRMNADDEDFREFEKSGDWDSEIKT